MAAWQQGPKKRGVEAQLSNYNPRAAPKGGLSALILSDLARGSLDSHDNLRLDMGNARAAGAGGLGGGKPLDLALAEWYF